jgi:hypothetical protein
MKLDMSIVAYYGVVVFGESYIRDYMDLARSAALPSGINAKFL